MSNDITSITVPKQDVTEYKEQVQSQLDKDLDFVHDNLKDMAEIASQSVAELAELATQSQNRLEYEKLAILLKAASDVHKDFIQVSQTKDILNRPPEPPPEAADAGTTNNLFVGSTSEMAELLKQLKAKQ